MNRSSYWQEKLRPFLPDVPHTKDFVRFGLSWTREDLALAKDHILGFTLAGSVLTPRLVRWLLYRLSGFDIDTPNIGDHCVFRVRKLAVMSGSLIGPYAFFNGLGSIEIGRETMIGPRSVILTSHHLIHQDGSFSEAPTERSVSIGSRVWVGADCTFAPGAVVENDCIIGAGALVTGRCERGGFYAGVPARRVSDREALHRP